MMMKKTIGFVLVLLLLLTAAAGCAETLTGTWVVGAIQMDGRIYAVHDVDGLADLYDSVYLWFDEDDTCGYINLYFHTGKCVPFRESSWLMKLDSTYTYEFREEQVEKVEVDSGSTSTYLVEVVDEGETLRFGLLDPFTGKIKTSATPLYFVKDDSGSSEYIAKYKAQVSGGSSSGTQASSDRSVTTGERNALRQAKLYLQIMPFSYKRLVEQLEYEGYTKTEAVYGASQCGAYWHQQAVEAARNYLELMPFSRSRLIEQLEYDGYTYDQAVYAAGKNGYE